MKFLFDIFPVIVFFAAYKLQGIFVATAVAIGATALQVAWQWFRHRKVDTMLWVSMGVIAVFGGATLLLQNETFIKWKPTVLYWLFAAVLLGGQALFGRNLIQAMLKDKITLPNQVWSGLNMSWIMFFTVMGAANLFVAYNFSTEAWVNFKLFGTMGLMLLFVLGQGVVLSRYMDVEEEKGG